MLDCTSMRQLLPVPLDPADPAAVYADVPVAEGRPGLRLNMIESVDGATAVDGRSGGLGGPPDHQVFMALRALTDVILVAAGTARAEGYGPALLSDEAQAARRGRGQAPIPPIAVVSRSLNLDWRSRFFTEAVARPVVVTVAAPPADALARAADVADVVIAGEDDVDLLAALRALGERGAASVLAEGGPTFNGALAAAGLIDELCLSVAPWLVGGTAKRVVAGPPITPPCGMELRSVGEEAGFLFLRYRTWEPPS